MNIGLGQSTYAYMIADPLAILAENEIHLGFSNIFHDPQSGFDQSMLHNMDVLVARLPAHLPSDIQKVARLSIIMAHTRHFGPYYFLSDNRAGSRCFQTRIDDVQRCRRLSFERLGLVGEQTIGVSLLISRFGLPADDIF